MSTLRNVSMISVVQLENLRYADCALVEERRCSGPPCGVSRTEGALQMETTSRLNDVDDAYLWVIPDLIIGSDHVHIGST